MDFRRLNSEPCIYVKHNDKMEIVCILAVYVDDILISGKENEILSVKEQIKMIFNIKDMGEIDFVIGIKFEKYDSGYVMHQKQYIKDLLLNKFNLMNSLPVRNLKPTEDI